MLFGYVFNITVVSAFINVFLSLKLNQVGGYLASVLIPLGAAVLLIVVMRIPAVRGAIDNLIRKAAGSFDRSGSSNTVMLIDHIGKGTIAQVTLSFVPDELKEKPLFLSGLKEEKNILVMLVEREGKVEPPVGQTVFAPGDKLTLFGDYREICRVFNAKEHFA